MMLGASVGQDRTISHNRTISDPLTLAMLPPANETSEEREQRLKEEVAAKNVSDFIDACLEEERLQRGRRNEVKILLLGQSGSGKSTIVKQFQLMYAPNMFHDACLSWRGVIYLNLVRPSYYVY